MADDPCMCQLVGQEHYGCAVSDDYPNDLRQAEPTYADVWHDAINETYVDDWDDVTEFDPATIRRVLTKAADILRGYSVSATFTGEELDLVRHLMPAHEVHQSGAKRFVNELFNEDNER